MRRRFETFLLPVFVHVSFLKFVNAESEYEDPQLSFWIKWWWIFLLVGLVLMTAGLVALACCCENYYRHRKALRQANEEQDSEGGDEMVQPPTIFKPTYPVYYSSLDGFRDIDHKALSMPVVQVHAPFGGVREYYPPPQSIEKYDAVNMNTVCYDCVKEQCQLHEELYSKPIHSKPHLPKKVIPSAIEFAKYTEDSPLRLKRSFPSLHLANDDVSIKI